MYAPVYIMYTQHNNMMLSCTMSMSIEYVIETLLFMHCHEYIDLTCHNIMTVHMMMLVRCADPEFSLEMLFVIYHDDDDDDDEHDDDDL